MHAVGLSTGPTGFVQVETQAWGLVAKSGSFPDAQVVQ